MSRSATNRTATPRHGACPRYLTGRNIAYQTGMTLIEVLMAVVILGTVLVGLMQGLTQCLAAFSLARRVQGMHSVANLGEIQHPMFIESDPETDLEVPPDSNIAEGYTFERTCEFASEDEEENLYIVHTIVKYGRGGAGNELALTRYVYYKE